MITYIAVAVVALLFVVVFVTGFALRKSGAPYGVPQLTVHKLISLAAVAFLGIAVYRAGQANPVSAIAWISVAATALFFIVAVATGGTLSTEKEWPPAISVMHRLSSWFTVASCAVTVVLLVT